MIGREAIFRLLPDRQGPCVSLYVPTDRAHRPEPDAIRFQNFLRCIENDLQLWGMAGAEIESLIQRFRPQNVGDRFWQEPSQGIAAFLAPGFSSIDHLPYAVAMQYRLDDRFHILPLLPLVDSFQRFFVLSLNQENTRFFEATAHSINEIHLNNSSSNAHLSADELERAPSLQLVESSNVGNSLATSLRHGTHASTVNEQRNDLLDSLRSIDRQLHHVLSHEQAPLVLAGFGFIASLYEGVNSYRHLLPVRIPGSPLNWTTDELHALAVDTVMPFLERDRQSAVSVFSSDEPRYPSTTDVSKVVSAADRGRVKTLFLARQGECDGFYDAEFQIVTLDPEGDDLLEFAVARVLLHGGQVCVLDRDEMPGRQMLAALLRIDDFTNKPRWEQS